eukprot:9531930-Alexandrium_andersonii.AAC.1
MVQLELRRCEMPMTQEAPHVLVDVLVEAVGGVGDAPVLLGARLGRHGGRARGGLARRLGTRDTEGR